MLEMATVLVATGILMIIAYEFSHAIGKESGEKTLKVYFRVNPFL